MGVFTDPAFSEHEQVVFCRDQKTGLRAIIAIHSTHLGPSLGGCRMWNYANEEDALRDVLRLSRGMTFKNAISGLKLGGGKSVIIGDAKKDKSEALFRSFGRFVNSLGGRYLTAEDVNIRVADMDHISKETKYFTGGSQGSGDPSPLTALGVFHGIRASFQHKYGQSDLHGVKIAVQGCGNVGTYLCQHLHKAGAELYVYDIEAERVQRLVDTLGAKPLSATEVLSADVDIFSPCALGGGLNDETIPKLKASIVAGGANNQLLDENRHAKMLLERGILYAPDYVINAGGVINCYQEIIGYNRQAAEEKATAIYDTLMGVFKEAESHGITTLDSSNKMVERKLQKPA